VPNEIDLALVALLAVGLPVYEHFTWPRTVAKIRRAPHRGRLRAYATTIALQWTLVAASAWSWRHVGREWTTLAMVAPHGWRLWLAAMAIVAVVLLQARNVRTAIRSAKARAHLRAVIATLDFLMPHAVDELGWFVALSLTAGVCEEFLFRGYFIGVLAPALGWWGAAALNVPIFGLLHAYQGRKGIMKTATVGAVVTLFVAATGSLYPAVILHAAVDIGSGIMFWVALREPVPSDVAGAPA
jgi:membrane protease YdiL (CAAX protease family)